MAVETKKKKTIFLGFIRLKLLTYEYMQDENTTCVFQYADAVLHWVAWW